MPKCVGLTGGIGSGKTSALTAFADCGAATLSSDDVVHELYAEPDVIALIQDRFGSSVRSSDGSVDRAALGAIAFADPDGITFLERVVFPRIATAREHWIRDRRAERRWPLLVVEVPLLFEAGLADLFDVVVVVTAGENIRRARVQARGQDFAERSGRQWPEERKIAAADRVFHNDGDLAALRAWVGSVYTEFATPALA